MANGFHKIAGAYLVQFKSDLNVPIATATSDNCGTVGETDNMLVCSSLAGSDHLGTMVTHTIIKNTEELPKPPMEYENRL